MFVGALNGTVRTFLGNIPSAFAGRKVIVGCSGNFTSEAVLSASSQPAEIHSNDVSFYSCMLGRWLTGKPLGFTVSNPEFDWLQPWLGEDRPAEERIAGLLVLLDALQFVKQNNGHARRMWGAYQDQFGSLVEASVPKVLAAKDATRVTSFFEGDVAEHFERFGDDPDAVFCCYAPTYKGGYERMYRALESIVTWEPPTYPLLDDGSRDRLIAWMRERNFLWYDDRVLPGLEPVMQQSQGRARTVYLYSNVVDRTAYFTDPPRPGLPNWPLVDAETVFTKRSQIRVASIKTTELACFKDAFLGKNIKFAPGNWAFAVLVDDRVAGFFEFRKDKFGKAGAYMMADFPIPGTRYARLSKLMVMCAVSGDTRKLLERAMQQRCPRLSTTAFTNRPVSMKYRGVLELVKRGETPDGQKFLNYEGVFNTQSYAQVFQEWFRKNAGATSANHSQSE